MPELLPRLRALVAGKQHTVAHIRRQQPSQFLQRLLEQRVPLCKCVCGKEKISNTNRLTNGETSSCGCLLKLIDLTGRSFHDWTVVSYSHKIKKGEIHRFYWNCVCSCGKERTLDQTSLLREKTKSCGCKKSLYISNAIMIHGDASKGLKTKEYRTWLGMKRRCYNSNRKDYKDYGGRGIKVCDRWLHSFQNFLSDLGRAPTPRHSIDRKNNDGNYEPSNCQWATDKEQQNNRRPRRRVA